MFFTNEVNKNFLKLEPIVFYWKGGYVEVLARYELIKSNIGDTFIGLEVLSSVELDGILLDPAIFWSSLSSDDYKELTLKIASKVSVILELSEVPEETKVCINLEAINILDVEFVDNLNSCIKPFQLCVELCESNINSTIERLTSVLIEVRRSGVEVWLDDFGADESNLNLVTDYHFDMIKIDRRLFWRLKEHPYILSRLIEVLKFYSDGVVLEGCEIASDVRLACELSCFCQGYVFENNYMVPAYQRK